MVEIIVDFPFMLSSSKHSWIFSRIKEDTMTNKSPNASGAVSIFASSEVAAQWQRGKALRDEVNAPANEMMLDLANLR